MAVKDCFWHKESAVDAAWATHEDNWWNNVLHRDGTDELGGVPTTGDSLYFLGTTAPADDGAAVSYALIDTSQLAADVTFTADVTLTGTLVLGVPGGSEVHTWGGDGGSVNNALIQGASVITTTIGKEAIFRDTASVTELSAIEKNSRFYDATGSTGGTFVAGNVFCYGNHTFTETSGNLVLTGVTIYVYGSLILNDTATNNITGTPTVYIMNRNASLQLAGAATANVVPYRLANAHRLRQIA